MTDVLYYVYCIFSVGEDVPIYIGITNNPHRRFVYHKCCIRKKIHHNIKLQRKVHKIWNNNNSIEMEILLSSYDYDLIKNFEKFFIAAVGRENLCNLTDGGEGCSGMIVSSTTREILRKKALGRRLPPLAEGVRERISFSLKGKRKTKDQRRKMSESHSGKILSSEHKIKIGIKSKEFWNSLTEKEKEVMFAKRILPRGSEKIEAKLNEFIVWEIKYGIYKDYSLKDLGKIFKISSSAICNIRKEKTWKHVKLELY